MYNMNIIKNNIDQQAAAVGTGLWSDFEQVDNIHKVEDTVKPISENRKKYDDILPIFKKASDYQSEIGDQLAGLRK
jgi:xylulokinase